MIVLHNLLDGITPEHFGAISWLWSILHYGDIIDLGNGYNFFPVYPLIPWVGVMAAGYCFGTIYQLNSGRRKNILIWLGAGMIMAFVFIRLSDFYGDSNHWTSQKNFIFTILDFINTTKYPPSFLFLLMTLGPAVLLLAFLENVRGKIRSFFVVFGRVPMFYYLIHVPVMHLLAILVAAATGTDPGFMINSFPFFWQTGWGYSLPVVYLAWIVVIVILYPICYRYKNYKERKKSKWLSYL